MASFTVQSPCYKNMSTIEKTLGEPNQLCLSVHCFRLFTKHGGDSRIGQSEEARSGKFRQLFKGVENPRTSNATHLCGIMRLTHGLPTAMLPRLFKTKDPRLPAEALARFGENLVTALTEAAVQRVAVGGQRRSETCPHLRRRNESAALSPTSGIGAMVLHTVSGTSARTAVWTSGIPPLRRCPQLECFSLSLTHCTHPVSR